MKNYCFNSNIYIYQKEAKWKTAEINTVRKVLKAAKAQRDKLTIRLSNDKEVKAFNLKWKGINKSTNILSFLNNENLFSFENNMIYLGDIIINIKKVKKKNFINNFDKLWIHGLLHLLGYTHKKDKEHKKMLKLERIYYNIVS